ncbi:protein of unknown function [Bradyrhizobium vignae]|uniref:Uncharacterized protein n=1 Tax=Bradyrhizobium vignae TaxID=1549949 RepID=A0A2U3Q0P2_9BRAD|nr:protein of unknown function [Bradyrhizobium vignae]
MRPYCGSGLAAGVDRRLIVERRATAELPDLTAVAAALEPRVGRTPEGSGRSIEMLRLLGS